MRRDESPNMEEPGVRICSYSKGFRAVCYSVFQFYF